MRHFFVPFDFLFSLLSSVKYKYKFWSQCGKLCRYLILGISADVIIAAMIIGALVIIGAK